MKTVVKMFKPQFAGMVERGTKLQTVRQYPKRMPRSGDRISLREWTGKPYRSKQRILGVGTITRVARCGIGPGLRIDGELVDPLTFAVADGFACWEELRDWFEREHGLPFAGILIQWRLTSPPETR